MKTIISERDLAELRELYIQANKEKFAAKKKWEKDVLNNSLEYMEKNSKSRHFNTGIYYTRY